MYMKVQLPLPTPNLRKSCPKCPLVYTHTCNIQLLAVTQQPKVFIGKLTATKWVWVIIGQANDERESCKYYLLVLRVRPLPSAAQKVVVWFLRLVQLYARSKVGTIVTLNFNVGQALFYCSYII